MLCVQTRVFIPLGVALLIHRANGRLAIQETARLFPKVTAPFYILTRIAAEFCAFHRVDKTYLFLL